MENMTEGHAASRVRGPATRAFASAAHTQPATSPATSLGRRGFLALGGALGLGVLISGCGDGGGNSGGAAASAQVKLPTYKEFAGVKADLPGNGQGLQAAFLSMPAEPVTSVKNPPIQGSVSALTETFETMSPAMPDNSFWQRLNKAMGGTLNLQIVEDVGDGYPAKFATILAGGDLPDMMWIPPNQGIPNVGPMLESKFQDLTSQLSGDAVLEYPNLAALKPDSWKTAVVNGKIWGAPIPSTPFGQVMAGNKDAWAQVGGFEASDGDEFFAKVKELTRPNEGKYALEPAYVNMLNMFTQWQGAPNGWAVNPDRSLTYVSELPEYQAAVEYAAKLFAAGVFYPDANATDISNRIVSGSVAAQVIVGPHDLRRYRNIDQSAQTEILIPFGATKGIRPVYYMGYGTVGFTAFPKADQGKIKELLNVANYLSAPFGTVEYLQKNYGTKGEDYTLGADGAPVYTASGAKDIPGLASALNIMSSPENVLYNPAHPEDTRYMYDQEKKLLTYAQRSPVLGTYSDTNAKVGSKIGTVLRDKVVDIITGRAKISELPDAVKRWRADGGDKIRDEYEKVLPKDVPVTGKGKN